MTRTATGAVLAACMVTVSVAGIGFGSVISADDAPAPAGGSGLHRTATLQVAAGSPGRQAAWEHERHAEAHARDIANRATQARTRVRAAASQEARPVTLDGFLGTFEITCYSLQGTTASGRPVSEDVVAVDPRVIPLGTSIVIDGLGTKVAGDTGANIRGNRLDIWKPSSEECIQFGRQHRKVWRA